MYSLQWAITIFQSDSQCMPYMQVNSFLYNIQCIEEIWDNVRRGKIQNYSVEHYTMRHEK